MVEIHERNTQRKLTTAVADSRYGKIDNFLLCHDRGIKAHMLALKETQAGTGRQEGIFPKEAFCYDPASDTFLCPAGHLLKKRMYHKRRKTYEYKASSKTCMGCNLRGQCTRAQDGRSLKRHERQDVLDTMLQLAGEREAKRDIKTRQHLAERSFAWSKHYGYKRARWRRLWRVEIQDFLIAAVQNITILVKYKMDNVSMSKAQRGHLREFQRITDAAFSLFRYSFMQFLRRGYSPGCISAYSMS